MNKDQLMATTTAIFVEAMRYNGMNLWESEHKLIAFDVNMAKQIAEDSVDLAIELLDAVDAKMKERMEAQP